VPDPVHAAPLFDYGPTTANVDGWLAELSVPSSPPPPSLHTATSLAEGDSGDMGTGKNVARDGRFGVYNSWFQFWFNTEHDAGYWIAPVITPSKST
jgi:hypothetical protein